MTERIEDAQADTSDVLDQVSSLRQQIRTLRNTPYSEDKDEIKAKDRQLEQMRSRLEVLTRKAYAELGVSTITNTVNVIKSPDIDHAADLRAQKFNTLGTTFLEEAVRAVSVEPWEFMDQPPLSPTEIVITSGHLAPFVGILKDMSEDVALEHMRFIRAEKAPIGTNTAAIVDTGVLLELLKKHKESAVFISEVFKSVQQEIGIMNVGVLTKMIAREAATLATAKGSLSQAQLHEQQDELDSSKYRVRRLHQMAQSVKDLVLAAREQGIPINRVLEKAQIDGATLDFDEVMIRQCDKNLLLGEYADSATQERVAQIIADCDARDAQTHPTA